MKRTRLLTAVAAAGLLVLAGCGGDDGGTPRPVAGSSRRTSRR